ncbi:type II toxin-antitoxin system HicA family toxin [Flectobacillus sp. DC10W]|uniref:Type II toxin-antitoxin system HicA family toxin n=1 Tax=Flectobacillus longus TaxID=2984207 RepID=A0ABT6YHE8_9BACT|nr:type II toxin-antitoxin system HicA family toxin [Flectobacillus longus]MDI9863026.1 type II toxin-antitoxin system HicA family toxin [Flectobacillus longus]
MTVAEVTSILESNGWVAVRTKGSHIIFKKTGNRNNVSVSSHGDGSEIPIGTLRSIFRKAGIKFPK